MKLGLSVFRKTVAILALFACVSSSGGHWVAPKLAVWALMIVDYSRSTSLVQAIETTITGKKLCQRCHSLSLAEQTEKRQAPISVDQLKSKLFLKAQPVVSSGRLPLISIGRFYQTQQLHEPIYFNPPTPPPRQSLV